MLLLCLCSRPLQPFACSTATPPTGHATSCLRPPPRVCVQRLRVSSLLCEHEILCHQVHLLRFAQLRQGIPPGFAKYTTGKTRTPNAKYNYEPERTRMRQVPLQQV
ncbi:hypothetical protein VPH35_013092 [Triticum aestivum]